MTIHLSNWLWFGVFMQSFKKVIDNISIGKRNADFFWQFRYIYPQSIWYLYCHKLITFVYHDCVRLINDNLCLVILSEWGWKDKKTEIIIISYISKWVVEGIKGTRPCFHQKMGAMSLCAVWDIWNEFQIRHFIWFMKLVVYFCSGGVGSSDSNDDNDE